MYTARSPFSSLSAGRRRILARTGGLLGVEVKYLDVYASNLAIPAPADCSGGEMQPEGGCTDCLSVPAQGDGAQNRDGKKITMRSIFVSGTVHPSGAVSDASDAIMPPHVYLALVLDTQANGATIVSEQVFTNPNDTPNANAKPLRNLEYSSRYRVLAQKTLSLAPAYGVTDGANTSSNVCTPKAFTLSYAKPIVMNFASTTADIANAKDNAIHLVAFATNASYVPNLSYNCRMRFVG